MKTHYIFSQQFRNDITTMMYANHVNRSVKDYKYVIDKYWYTLPYHNPEACIDVYRIVPDLELIGEQFYTITELKPYRHWSEDLFVPIDKDNMVPMRD